MSESASHNVGGGLEYTVRNSPKCDTKTPVVKMKVFVQETVLNALDDAAKSTSLIPLVSHHRLGQDRDRQSSR